MDKSNKNRDGQVLFRPDSAPTEITLKEVEVQKLNLQPGDTLVVTIRTEDVETLDQSFVKALQDGFRKRFVNNKIEVVMLAMNEAQKIDFTVVKEKPAQNYCDDCGCGKKEAAERRG